MKCSNCGTENDENQNMCKICGNTLQTLKTDENTYNQQTHNYNQYTAQEFKKSTYCSRIPKINIFMELMTIIIIMKKNF